MNRRIILARRWVVCRFRLSELSVSLSCFSAEAAIGLEQRLADNRELTFEKSSFQQYLLRKPSLTSNSSPCRSVFQSPKLSWRMTRFVYPASPNESTLLHGVQVICEHSSTAAPLLRCHGGRIIDAGNGTKHVPQEAAARHPSQDPQRPLTKERLQIHRYTYLPRLHLVHGGIDEECRAQSTRER